MSEKKWDSSHGVDHQCCCTLGQQFTQTRKLNCAQLAQQQLTSNVSINFAIHRGLFVHINIFGKEQTHLILKPSATIICNAHHLPGNQALTVSPGSLKEKTHEMSPSVCMWHAWTSRVSDSVIFPELWPKKWGPTNSMLPPQWPRHQKRGWMCNQTQSVNSCRNQIQSRHDQTQHTGSHTAP